MSDREPLQASDDQLHARRERVAAAFDLDNAVVLIGAGRPIPVPGGLDRLHPFAPHPHYQWLAGHRRPGGVVAFDADDGRWHDFVPETTADDRLWEGKTDAPGEPLSAFRPWLDARRGRPIAMLGVALPEIPDTEPLSTKLDPILLAQRRIKDDAELARIRTACNATARGFDRARETIALPHATERLVRIELEAECFRRGAEGMGYDTIVGVGGNAAILHFAPGERPITDGDFVLIDAGCHFGGYTADVTRTFVKGTPTAKHHDLYHIVLEAERAGIERCRPGQEWRELHLTIAEQLAEGLVRLGVLRGEPAGLVERDAHALFFPHGLGHLVGLGVRDATGYLAGRHRSERFGLGNLRMDLPLAPGMVTTVEPGLYFIPRLLRDAEIRDRYADAVDWDAVERWIGIGGVRIEDDVLITDAAPINLTEAIDKSFDSMTVPL